MQRTSYAGGQLPGRLTSLVRVTASDGTVGWGSAYSHPELVRIVIEDHLKPLLLGDDPREVEAVWSKMYQATRWYGRKGVALSALGALDIAFWDLRGKALCKTVQELLGGSRERVPAYASALLWTDSLESLGREAAGYVEQGYRRVKMRLGKDEDYDVAAVRTVRQAVGPAVDVIVDASMRYSLEVARRMATVLEENLGLLVRRALRARGHRQLCRPAEGLQGPGGRGGKRVRTAGIPGNAQGRGPGCGPRRTPVEPAASASASGSGGWRRSTAPGSPTHTWSDALALTANMHVIAALPNGITVEVDRTDNPFIDDLLVEPHRIEDGCFRLPKAPGLGIDLDEAVIRRWTMPAGQRLPIGPTPTCPSARNTGFSGNRIRILFILCIDVNSPYSWITPRLVSNTVGLRGSALIQPSHRRRWTFSGDQSVPDHPDRTGSLEEHLYPPR